MTQIDKRNAHASLQMADAMNKFGGAGGAGSNLKAMGLLGQPNNSNNLLTITSTSYTVVSGVTKTLSFLRPVDLRIDVQSGGNTTGGSGSNAFGALHVDGTLAGGASISAASFIWDKANAGIIICTGWQLIRLQPGTHTIDFRVKVDSGQTWHNWYTEIDIFQMGV